MQELHDIDAEKAVIGSILINPGALIDVATIVQAEDFHDEKHTRIYDAMLALQGEQTPIDHLTLCNHLEIAGHLRMVGGAAYLIELTLATPTSMNAIHYAIVVNRLGTLRRLITATGRIAKLTYDSTGANMDDVFAKVRKLIDAAAPMNSDEAVLLWLDSLDVFFDGQYQRCDELDRIDRGELPAHVSLPWEAVKHYIPHIHTGMLAVIAAETSVGKTTAIECCAEHWARQGLHVALFHLELSHKFMLDRRMARQSGETLATIEGGEVTDRMREADERMRTWRGAIHYVHCPGWSAYQIVQKARQLNARGLCDVLIVDYLQKLRLGFRNGENKADAIGNAVEGLKNGLEQMDIAGLLASQFSRRSNAQSRKTADLIRGSGEVEEKANIVITLDRDILTSEVRGPQGNIVAYAGERSPQVRVRVDKNTAGPTGDCELVMNGARFLMLDKTIAKAEPSEPIF